MRPGTRILVIDDDPGSGRLVTDYLRAMDATVEWVRDGSRGLELATSRDFDCIILDLRLPGENGFVVAEKIRKTVPGGGPPIIVTSAYPEKPNRLRAFKAGVDAFLAKPVDLTELGHLASSLTARKQEADMRLAALLTLITCLLRERGGSDSP
ncbi:MAG TPA: hypothetical protein DHW14_06225 [Clostridiales bacterium]|nr:hypothetical protein [Clostridiales bacterium]